ncbi:MAG: hypothetical protein CBARDCOR_3145 [uncultured Caballeronia sp.]|nr:MAG: hypothetical protein CBARDCOR_3145 [uncultured Caballeronia sp.]
MKNRTAGIVQTTSVLIVDDDLAVCDLLSRFLKARGLDAFPSFTMAPACASGWNTSVYPSWCSTSRCRT